jgi:hypothetical protein
MPGSASVPNVINNQPSGNIFGSVFDANWNAITSYINVREATVGTLGSRPTPGIPGRYYFATDDAGGTFFLDTGATWQRLAPGLSGVFISSFIDVADIIVPATGVLTQITNETPTVPASSQVMLLVTVFAHQQAPGTSAGALQLRAGTGPTPPVVSAVYPLDIFDSSAYAALTFSTLTPFVWGGGVMTVILEGSVNIGAAPIEFGTATLDPRFERSFTVTAYQ